MVTPVAREQCHIRTKMKVLLNLSQALGRVAHFRTEQLTKTEQFESTKMVKKLLMVPRVSSFSYIFIIEVHLGYYFMRLTLSLSLNQGVAKNQSEDPRGVKLTSPDRSETVISNVDPPSMPSPIITQQSNVDPPTPSIRSPPHLAGGSPDNTLRLGSPAVHETAQDEAAVDTAGDEVEQVNEDVLVVPVEEDEVPALEAVQPALEEAVLEEAVQPALEEAVLGEAEQPALVEAVLPLPQVHPVMMLVTAAFLGLKYLVMMIATVALYLVMMIATVAFEALSVYCEALVVMQDDAEEHGLPFLFGPIVENNNGD